MKGTSLTPDEVKAIPDKTFEKAILEAIVYNADMTNNTTLGWAVMKALGHTAGWSKEIERKMLRVAADMASRNILVKLPASQYHPSIKRKAMHRHLHRSPSWYTAEMHIQAQDAVKQGEKERNEVKKDYEELVEAVIRFGLTAPKDIPTGSSTITLKTEDVWTLLAEATTQRT